MSDEEYTTDNQSDDLSNDERDSGPSTIETQNQNSKTRKNQPVTRHIQIVQKSNHKEQNQNTNKRSNSSSDNESETHSSNNDTDYTNPNYEASFLSRDTFNKIVIDFMNQRKNDKGIIRLDKYQQCIEILKDLTAKSGNAKLKFWAKGQFTLIKVGGLYVLNLKHEERQVVPFEDWYGVFCQIHQKCGHGGQSATWKRVSLI